MHSIHLTSHTNKNGLLTVQLPQEWAEQEVDVVLKLEKPAEQGESLAQAFDLLANMTDDFMSIRPEDTTPQTREDW